MQTLNKEGNAGWEATGTIEATIGRGVTNEIAILLKRPLSVETL